VLPEQEAPFLSAVDGMLYGDDPAQGFVLGNRFAHPGLGIGFEAPPGFTLTNSPRAVGIQGPNSERGEFSTGPVGRSLEDYAYGVLERLVGRTPAQAEPPVRTRINGLEAVILPARAQTNSGVVEVTVAAYQAGGSAYHFVTLAPAGRGRIWDPLFGSFHRLSAREAAELRPRRLEIVTARPGDTAASLAARMAYDDLREERFRLLNGLGPGEPIRPGQPVKLVTFAPR
jgi:predicted Zn-dependent protease